MTSRENDLYTTHYTHRNKVFHSFIYSFLDQDVRVNGGSFSEISGSGEVRIVRFRNVS